VAADFSALCRTTLDYHDDLIRNIKSIRISQDLFDDLAENAEETRVAIAAESALRIPTVAPAITRPFDYGSVITYSFESAHWQATRFSDGTRYGVWYGAPDVKTTVYETAFHWHRFIMDSFATETVEIIGDRRLFDIQCDGLLIDTREQEHRHRQLVSRKSYLYTQAFGRYLLEQQQNGLLVMSARCNGTNVAILNPARLSKVRDKQYLTYRCKPMRDRIQIEQTPHRTWFAITPSTLY
jgi:RES domain